LEDDVTPGFTAALELPLREGRDFDEHDRLSSGMVAIVNDVVARREWPGQSALGKRLKLLGPPDDWATVVGVVGTLKQRSVGETDEPEIYRPIAQQPYVFSSLVIRTVGDPAALAPSVRAAIWSVDPDQPVWRIVPLESMLAQQLATPTFTLMLNALSALLALLLASVGVYGVMSYVTEERTREIGIRMALGAGRGNIIGLFLGKAAPVIVTGASMGLVAALGGAKLLQAQRQLFGVTAFDLPTFVAVPLLLSAVALVACYAPARRASLVDPAVTLRAD
ncbi:MAG TPA: FtsX-like permease family protein, partial [Gemmatimonadales bacterium]